MTAQYAVTFEFDVQAPITHRGTVAASTMPTCFARATREAVKAHPGLRWSSVVCVLLKRDAEAIETTDEATGAATAGGVVSDAVAAGA